MIYDDEHPIAKPPMVSLPCPCCPQAIRGLSDAHVRYLLAMHLDDACQGILISPAGSPPMPGRGP